MTLNNRATDSNQTEYEESLRHISVNKVSVECAKCEDEKAGPLYWQIHLPSGEGHAYKDNWTQSNQRDNKTCANKRGNKFKVACNIINTPIKRWSPIQRLEMNTKGMLWHSWLQYLYQKLSNHDKGKHKPNEETKNTRRCRRCYVIVS